MGLLGIVPGGSEISTTLGVMVGGMLGYFTGKYAASQEIRILKKQYHSLEEEVQDLRKRLGTVEETRLQRALLKTAILRQLAWKDNILDPREQLFFYIILSYNILIFQPITKYRSC